MRNHVVRLHRMIERTLFYVDPPLSYSRTLQALRFLVGAIQATDDDSLWYIGEGGSCDLGSLIVGAYWFCVENHGGQNSQEYLTLCRLGEVFSPGCTSGPEPDSTEIDVYQQLMALQE